MNKFIYTVSIFLAFTSFSWAQSDQDFVFWQKSIGTQGEDELNDMVYDVDGNAYVVGSTQTAGSQSMDILVAKYSSDGIEIWSRILGEAGDDRGVGIELMNGNLFVVGSSSSTTGIFSESEGREDIVLIQLNSSGDQIGFSRYGGNLTDVPTDISSTINGDLLISAYSTSTEGFLDSNYGQSDIWAFRVDNQGELIWKKHYGGSDEDFSSKIEELPTGEISLFGHSASFDGDIGVNYGDLDLSLFKLSSNGKIIWERNYGGLHSEVGVDLLINDNDEIIIVGNTSSLSYDISKNAGFSDAWVLEIDPLDGAIIWEETHGSEFSDFASVLKVDQNNELFLMGVTNAPLFFGEQSLGGEDVWLARVNSPESIEHVSLFGGNGFESVADFKFNSDGSILLVGASNSTNGLFSTNNGKLDGWMMKVELDDQHQANPIETVSAHPNPTNGTVYLNNLTESDEIIVFNSMGQVVIESFQATAFSEVIDLKNVTPGVYLVSVQRAESTELIRLVRN